MQYALVKPLINQLFRAPGIFAETYQAVVIALTSVGGCLMLACLVMASVVRRWDGSLAGRLSILMHHLAGMQLIALCYLPSIFALNQCESTDSSTGLSASSHVPW